MRCQSRLRSPTRTARSGAPLPLLARKAWRLIDGPCRYPPDLAGTCAENGPSLQRSTRHRVSALKQPSSYASLSCPPRRADRNSETTRGKRPLKASKREFESKLMTLFGCGWRRHRVPGPRPVLTQWFPTLRALAMISLNDSKHHERQI